MNLLDAYWQRRDDANQKLADLGASLVKQAATPEPSPSLVGRLYATPDNWLLLSVPNALVRGMFGALSDPGIELPTHEGNFSAHITVAGPEELEQIGGADRITERGKSFSYGVDGVYSVRPEGWPEMGRVWYLKVLSPELEKLRKTYGLDPKRKGHDFHITLAVRRKGVLADNAISKAAEKRAILEDLANIGGLVQFHPSPPCSVHTPDDCPPPIESTLRSVFGDDHFSKGGALPDEEGWETIFPKQAVAFNFGGDVQGVHFRRNWNHLLDQAGAPGFAENHPETGSVYAVVDAGPQTQKDVLAGIAQFMAKSPKVHAWHFDPTAESEKLYDVALSDADLEDTFRREKLTTEGEPTQFRRQWAIDRYRLHPNGAGQLIGRVPLHALQQLHGSEPIYAFQEPKAAGDPFADRIDSKPTTKETMRAIGEIIRRTSGDAKAGTKLLVRST